MMIESQSPRKVFGDARWIWHEAEGYDLLNCFVQARRTFSLAAVPRVCRVTVTADSRYKLYVNGRYVCHGPARGYQYSWPYDVVDIAPLLRRGGNAIAILAYNYGTGMFQYISAGSAGIILSGRAGRTDISTGASWKVRRAPGYDRTQARVSMELGFQEKFDARLDDGSWLSPAYDDSSWMNPRTVAAGSMPWHSVEPRGIPMLREEVIAPVALLAEGEGKSAATWRAAENLTANYHAEKRRWKKASQAARRGPKSLTFTARTTGRGRFRAYLVDFGQEVLGSILTEVSGASGGEAVDIQVAETVTGFEPDVVDPQEGCRIAFCNRLVLKTGVTRHEQFDPWGFRYAAVIVRDAMKPLNVRVSLRTAMYPLAVKGAFESSDSMLDDIYRISVRAQECCMMDAYVDCPWREQAQWWGDARVQAANTFHLSADPRLLARGIRQAAGQGSPNGLTYGLMPTTAHHCILPDYTLTWIMTIWDYYYQTGDKSLILEYAPRMLEALSYFASMREKNGLIPYDDRYWLFLDWADVFKDGYPTIYNIFYFWALKTASALFALIDFRDESRYFAREAARTQSAIMSKLFDRKRGRFYGGLDWKRKAVRHDTPHSYALAILSGLCPARDGAFVSEVLLPLLRGRCPGFRAAETLLTGVAGEKFPTAPSPFFMYYVFQALKSHGYGAETIDCIRRWYGTFVEDGFTTTPEMWGQFRGRWSACHAWSAHSIVHLHNTLLGVTQAEVGWEKIRFAPYLERLQFARGAVATPFGLIRSSWRRTGDRVDVRVRIPRGITAAVQLPGVRESVSGGSHRWSVGLRAGRR